VAADAAPRLYLITDRTLATRGLADVVRDALAAIPPGGAWVQLRETDLDGGALVSLARELIPVVRERNTKLFVNDRVDVALAAGADGVHLPASGIDVDTARAIAPRLDVGVSTHTVAEARAAFDAGASPVVYGPVWPTRDKPDGVGLAGLPAGVHAIGGITTPDHARAARAAGAVGVACIRAVFGSGDPGAAARALYEAAA
jgi:thiamine-phosphate pyrophosphorylase